MPNSWQPDHESHGLFKDMIIEAFQNNSMTKFDEICQKLAQKSVQSLSTPEGSTYTVIVMIIKQQDYKFNEKLTQAWGTYCEYLINQDYIVVFKDGLRDGQECIE